MITKLRVAGGDDGEPDGAEEEDDELLGDLGQQRKDFGGSMKVVRPTRESLDLNEGLGVSVVVYFSDSFRLT